MMVEYLYSIVRNVKIDEIYTKYLQDRSYIKYKYPNQWFYRQTRMSQCKTDKNIYHRSLPFPSSIIEKCLRFDDFPSINFSSLQSGRKHCSIEVSSVSSCWWWILIWSGVCFENSEKNHEDISGCHWNCLGKSIHIFGALFLQNFEEDDIQKATRS